MSLLRVQGIRKMSLNGAKKKLVGNERKPMLGRLMIHSYIR